MSTSTASAEIPLTDDDIAGWLRSHPDFFQRNSELLATLRVPHPAGGAISLIERQIELLREKNQSADARFAELVSVARANEQLAARVHRYTRRLMRAPTRRAILLQVEAGLREDFDVTQSVLLLFGSGNTGAEDTGRRFVRQVAADDPALAGFESLFAAGKPRCGQIRDTQREFLFGSDAASVGSVALVPLAGDAPLGLLALASLNSQRFHPGMSTEFLARLGELTSDALARD